MDIYETIASIFSLVSVYLTAKQNNWCWLVGIIGIIFYGVVFLESNLIGNFWLQFLFLSQSLFGVWNWNKKKDEPIISWHPDWSLIFGSFSMLSVISICIIEDLGGSMPMMDGITTSLSIFGMYLLAHKRIDAWLYWISADVIFIFMFYQSGLWLSTITYLIFLIMAIGGLFNWIKISKESKI